MIEGVGVGFVVRVWRRAEEFRVDSCAELDGKIEERRRGSGIGRSHRVYRVR